MIIYIIAVKLLGDWLCRTIHVWSYLYM